MTNPEISIILPCRNEEKAIGHCINTIKKVLKEYNINAEIIVSDSSVDKSPIIAKQLGAKVKTFDPYIKELSNVETLKDAMDNVEAIVLCTDHKEFKDLNIKKVFSNSKVKVIIDGRNIWDKEKIEKLGIIYKGVGK